jgi:dTDP-4-dehydrorhamnose 3,5-epimerase
MLVGMIKTDLNIIEADSGSVYHGVKNTDTGFTEFGEVYFSTVKINKTKAWKLHKEMTLNLFVPIGSVQFYFVDGREKSKTYNEKFGIILSQNPYLRLTVPPGLWFGFRGISEGMNFICNVADIPHDPDEVLRKELNEIEWSLV